MEWKIRQVREDELIKIKNLLKKTNLWKPQRKLKSLKIALKISNDLFLALKQKEEIVGTCRAVWDGYYATIYDFAILPKFQKKGAFYAFLNSTDNAVSFYLKAGYSLIKTHSLVKEPI
ncbi:MAG: hypothetical protein HYU63_05105 [Armatimonadetes bacterium]|nr:hypothetical protein [Armatimonadota bacterium]